MKMFKRKIEKQAEETLNEFMCSASWKALKAKFAEYNIALNLRYEKEFTLDLGAWNKKYADAVVIYNENNTRDYDVILVDGDLLWKLNEKAKTLMNRLKNISVEYDDFVILQCLIMENLAFTENSTYYVISTAGKIKINQLIFDFLKANVKNALSFTLDLLSIFKKKTALLQFKSDYLLVKENDKAVKKAIYLREFEYITIACNLDNFDVVDKEFENNLKMRLNNDYNIDIKTERAQVIPPLQIVLDTVISKR